MSHRIQPPAEFRVILMFGASGDAFNCLDCIQPNDSVTAKKWIRKNFALRDCDMFLR